MDDTREGKVNKYLRYGNHNITVDDFDLILCVQEHKCCICKSDFRETKACLDHNHTTGVIRGILCGHCNSGIGFFRENPDFLNSAIDYLIHHERCPRPKESVTLAPRSSRFYESMLKLKDEDHIQLCRCSHLFPKGTRSGTIRNYVAKGRVSKITGRRVYLEAYRSATWVTTKQAIQRFIAHMNGGDPD